MFAGHLGAGLGLGALSPRRNPGVLVLAAFALDIVLWCLVLFGIERAVVPADYDRRHYLTFSFPYSHGLVASHLWAVAFFLVVGRGPWGRLVAAAVLSHFVLDWLVHVPEMTVLGAGSRALGLGLWNDMPLALAVESAVTLGGLAIFLRLAHLPRARAIALGVVALSVLGMTIVGQTIAPAPPSGVAAATAGLSTIAVTVALVAWIARRER